MGLKRENLELAQRSDFMQGVISALARQNGGDLRITAEALRSIPVGSGLNDEWSIPFQELPCTNGLKVKVPAPGSVLALHLVGDDASYEAEFFERMLNDRVALAWPGVLPKKRRDADGTCVLIRGKAHPQQAVEDAERAKLGWYQWRRVRNPWEGLMLRLRLGVWTGLGRLWVQVKQIPLAEVPEAWRKGTGTFEEEAAAQARESGAIVTR